MKHIGYHIPYTVCVFTNSYLVGVVIVGEILVFMTQRKELFTIAHVNISCYDLWWLLIHRRISFTAESISLYKPLGLSQCT